jgi:hypothetical protein
MTVGIGKRLGADLVASSFLDPGLVGGFVDEPLPKIHGGVA